MEFLTFDAELADRILPSFYSISCITWQDFCPVSKFSLYLNPECEIEDFFLQRPNTPSLAQLAKCPSIRDIWIYFYDYIENKTIFAHNANRVFSELKQLADINYLNMPDFYFLCTASLANRLWKGILKDTKLSTITNTLSVSNFHYNSEADAVSIFKIVQKGFQITTANSVQNLIALTGISSGFFSHNYKYLYRTRFNKATNLYERILSLPKSRKETFNYASVSGYY